MWNADRMGKYSVRSRFCNLPRSVAIAITAYEQRVQEMVERGRADVAMDNMIISPTTVGDFCQGNLAGNRDELLDFFWENKAEPKRGRVVGRVTKFFDGEIKLMGEKRSFNEGSKGALPCPVVIPKVGLEVTTLPPAEATQSTDITVEGFEGKYGGIEFGNEQTTIGEAFEGFSDAWGGGLNASEFLENKRVKKQEGLNGLELLQTGDSAAPATATVVGADGGKSLENILVKKTEMKGPEMYISKEISAEFRESLLARVGLMGVVYLRTMPPKGSGDQDTEFSFRVEGTSSVKRFVMQSSRRVRLIKRHSGTLLSVMIQYVSNPELLAPLNDVTFILKLPVDPTLLKVLPKAVLNRSERELKWHVPEIPLKGTPGKLRARMHVDSNEDDEELEVVAYVKFSMQGAMTLSGVCLRPASEGKTDFYEVNHRYESGVYTCN
ncbi:hypothetical protein COLO4_04392 [Corchorus olitorius]|uniref:MHD domain-containing protein n=1 Tax=Corchorus olitorius TaxID=93759 RepID=A0A1R3KU46_9ROSI|nr:hypothetical protein COLO4_04392 [Corchorus olitorius]